MIGGFIIGGGNGSTQVVVRGLGPTLAIFGVLGALSDQVVTLVDDHDQVRKGSSKCRFCGDEIVLNEPQGFEDFIVHELTHRRQAALLREHKGEWGWAQHVGRGAHRDKGWYSAIAEAAPNYLGVEVPADVWPKRNNPDTLTEPEMTHWPMSIRHLAEAQDPRLTAGAAPPPCPPASAAARPRDRSMAGRRRSA